MLKKNISLLRIAFEIILVLISVCIRALSLTSNSGSSANYAFLITAVAAAALMAYNCFKQKPYAPVFGGEKNEGLKLASYFVSVGFFAEFINRCISVYYYFNGEGHFLKISLVIRMFTGAFALLSAIYFVPVGLTFGGGRYDVRLLKLFHIVPILWAIGRLLEAMEQSGMDSKSDISGVIKYLMLSFALCFFYCFAREVESVKECRTITAVLAFLTAYFSLLYFADTLMVVLRKRAFSGAYELLLALTAASLFAFSVSFYKNIISNNTTEI